MIPAKDNDDDEFFRALIFPEEDRALFTTAKWNGGHRWFRSPNVVCIEKHPRPIRPNQPGHPGAVVSFRRRP
jgi:hypothetical protein